MPADRRDRRAGTVVAIVGTRPEAIKLRPVVKALAERGMDQQVVLTGQHKGLASHFDFVGTDSIRDLRTDTAEQSAGEIAETIHYALCDHLDRREAALVLVQGDTSSAYAGALAARDCGVALGHVEAGLRTFDLQQPWPEEGHRVAIDAMSRLLFAPTDSAARNLAAEPQVRGTVFVTGNSGIDALLQARQAAPPQPEPEGGRKRILVTCHRRENRGRPLHRVALACRRLVRELPVEIVLPVHPSPQIRGDFERLLKGVPHVHLIEPLDYEPMVGLIASSWLIVTDSGGLQEEAPALGKPVLVLRSVTERAEALDTANAELVGTDTDRICAAVERLLRDEERYRRMAVPSFPFGDGSASVRIAEAVHQFLKAGEPSLP